MEEFYNENECPDYLKKFLTYVSTIKGRGYLTGKEYFFDIRTFLRYLRIKNEGLTDNFEEIEIVNTPLSYIESFTEMDAYEYMVWLENVRDNHAAARARKTTSLKQFVNYLSNKAHLIPENKLQNLEAPSIKKENKLPKFLDVKQMEKLLESVDTKYPERDYCIITLFCNCGMRLAELCGINIEDIGFDDCSLRLFGKGRKERIVYLNEACLDAIREYLPIRQTVEVFEGNKQPLFISEKERRISRRRVQEIVKECLKSAGMQNKGITPHKLRHSAATMIYESTDDLLAVKEILGHETVQTTQIYTHLNTKKIAEAMSNTPISSNKRKKK